MPKLVFLCVHNAGRSQMAAGFARAAAPGLEVLSGGSDPAAEAHPTVVRAMAERSIDLTGAVPRRWEIDDLRDADVVVTMGCGDECPVLPGVTYEDWDLTDPAGRSIEEVREVRDEIERRVTDLLDRLGAGG